MAQPIVDSAPQRTVAVSPLQRWLLQNHVKEAEGPHEPEGKHHTHPWWQVMCLTGVDYFSTLGYQPGIAALVAGALSPFATLVLVLLTLFGALPMYNRVAAESPHGDGSISMLERLMTWWKGKLFVLCLIGFAATSFIITITLSAADATEHLVENPLVPHFLEHYKVSITLVMIALLAGVFLIGFSEAVLIAVGVVILYIGLNLVVVGTGFQQIVLHPDKIGGWREALFQQHGSPLAMIAGSLLVFPKLALGLSGFETGVVIMPLVKGDPTDTPEKPEGRIRNTRKLLAAAAVIMSFLLLSSSLVTTLLIPQEAFKEGGEASGRALAYVAHHYLGNVFGTIYDISTILILWFAGASAMAGLLNIVPRYLPRYGMAPDWTRAPRPLVLLFTAICFVVTIVFKADVHAQGGAYATGVLTLMGSAAVAVTLSTWREGNRARTFGFGLVTLIFLYTTVVTIVSEPEGIKIAGFFIAAIVATSLVSRISRATELRVERVELDARAKQFLEEMATLGEIRIIANKRQRGDEAEYRQKERQQREDNHIPPTDPILFLEVEIGDASDFAEVLTIEGIEVTGVGKAPQGNGSAPYRFRVLRVCAFSVPNAIAALMLHIRDTMGKKPHVYFSWSEGSPLAFLVRFLLLGEGDTAPVTHEILRKAEPDPERRPAAHVG
jgi:hypothetical protein